MINRELLNPNSIVVVGASNDLRKPGGKILKNILDHGYSGNLYVVNPKASEIQGVRSVAEPDDLPQVELAILAVPAGLCPSIVATLARQKGTKSFIIISAGFSEENEAGKRLETEITELLNETGGCLIGPNCTGVITTGYAGCFTLPIPKLDPKGIDLISGSGATAVFILEAAIPMGLTFSSVFSVGNSAQTGVEDVLEYMDEQFDPDTSSPVKLLYLESIQKPQKLLKHASSLIRKGCRIAAIKAGSSEAGSRAASSHTGALASPDAAVDALFRKAGIIRCYGRTELVYMGGLLLHKKPRGKRIAVVTHAGGPAVMLTDTLSSGGLEVPPITGDAAQELLGKLHPGSSVSNPIDVLATGDANQMEAVIDCVDKQLVEIDAMCIIFGSPGLDSVEKVYNLIDEKMRSSRKPIYPILPSTTNAGREIELFQSRGRVSFPDEVLFGKALVKYCLTPDFGSTVIEEQKLIPNGVRIFADRLENGYLEPGQVNDLLSLAGIPLIPQVVAKTCKEALDAAHSMGFPVVMKVVGPLHKTDVGGVLLNLGKPDDIEIGFDQLMSIQGASGVLLQPMLRGRELFVGAKLEKPFGHLVVIGLGGIFVEILKDVQSGLSPLTRSEVEDMIARLKGRSLLKGVRGQHGVSEDKWVDLILAVSLLVQNVPEIAEMDLNPVMGLEDQVVAVDARIRIEK